MSALEDVKTTLMGPPRGGSKLGTEQRISDLEFIIEYLEGRITQLETRLTHLIEVHNGNVAAYGKYFDAYEDRQELLQMSYNILAREVFTVAL